MGTERKQLVRVVIATDGKRGHENQSRVLARMLGDEQPLLMYLRESVRNGGVTEFLLRLRFALGGRNAVGKARSQGLVQRLLRPADPAQLRELAEQVKEARPRIFTVSTGTPPATFNLLLARLLDAEPVVCMTPSLQRRSHFALNVVPAQDIRDGVSPPDNVIATPLALAWHDSARAQQLAWQLRQRYDLPADARYVGLAVGGPTRHAPWSESEMLKFLGALERGAAAPRAPAVTSPEYGELPLPASGIIATNSRRTPARVTAKLQELACSGVVAAFIDANEDPVNPLPAFYEVCHAVCITCDSFSMLSEAVNAGQQPLVLTLGAPLRGKLARTVDTLAAAAALLEWDGAGEIRHHAATVRERGEPNSAMLELQTRVREKLSL